MWSKFVDKFGPNRDLTGNSFECLMGNEYHMSAEYDKDYDFMDLSVRHIPSDFLHFVSTSCGGTSDVYDLMFASITRMLEGVKRDVSEIYHV